MQVNVSSLKTNLDKLNSLADKYNLTYLNLYNELNNSKSYANSYKFRLFYNSVDKEKIATIDFYHEILALKKIYSFIFDNYSDIGQLIQFDLDKKDYLYSCFKDIKSKISVIRSKLNSINTSKFYEVSNYVKYAKGLLTAIQNNINIIEKKYRDTINKIDSIERKVSSSLNNLDISIIKESDIERFI